MCVCNCVWWCYYGPWQKITMAMRVKYQTQKFLREPSDQVFVFVLLEKNSRWGVCICFEMIRTKSGQVYKFALSIMLFAGLLFWPGCGDVVMGPDKKDYTDNQIKILQTAALGEHVTLPCRVENKQGNLQWTRSTSSQLKSIIDRITQSHKHHIKNKLIIILNICSDCRDDFGLGRNRDLKGFEHHMSSFSPNWITSSTRLPSSLLCIISYHQKHHRQNDDHYPPYHHHDPHDHQVLSATACPALTRRATTLLTSTRSPWKMTQSFNARLVTSLEIVALQTIKAQLLWLLQSELQQQN